MDKIIISDTSCLIALSNIGQLTLLNRLFQHVYITREVLNEFENLVPVWIIIKEVKDLEKQFAFEKRLDRGEASALALALETDNSLLIIDEIKGRKFAQSLNIDIIGTIGILLLAHKKGLLDNLSDIIRLLVENGFRVSQSILKTIKENLGKD